MEIISGRLADKFECKVVGVEGDDPQYLSVELCYRQRVLIYPTDCKNLPTKHFKFCAERGLTEELWKLWKELALACAAPDVPSAVITQVERIGRYIGVIVA